MMGQESSKPNVGKADEASPLCLKGPSGSDGTSAGVKEPVSKPHAARPLATVATRCCKSIFFWWPWAGWPPLLGSLDLAEDRQFARSIGGCIIVAYAMCVWISLSTSVAATTEESVAVLTCNATETAECFTNATVSKYGLSLVSTIATVAPSLANDTVFESALCWRVTQASGASMCVGYSHFDEIQAAAATASGFGDVSAKGVSGAVTGMAFITLLVAPWGNSAYAHDRALGFEKAFGWQLASQTKRVAALATSSILCAAMAVVVGFAAPSSSAFSLLVALVACLGCVALVYLVQMARMLLESREGCAANRLVGGAFVPFLGGEFDSQRQAAYMVYCRELMSRPELPSIVELRRGERTGELSVKRRRKLEESIAASRRPDLLGQVRCLPTSISLLSLSNLYALLAILFPISISCSSRLSPRSHRFLVRILAAEAQLGAEDEPFLGRHRRLPLPVSAALPFHRRALACHSTADR